MVKNVKIDQMRFIKMKNVMP